MIVSILENLSHYNPVSIVFYVFKSDPLLAVVVLLLTLLRSKSYFEIPDKNGLNGEALLYEEFSDSFIN